MIDKRKALTIFCLLAGISSFAQKHSAEQSSHNKPVAVFKEYKFTLNGFKEPSLSFGPMARWWWPGNDVTSEELKREIALFARTGFAGVEVQPVNLLVPATGAARQRVQSWDTPEYYANLRTVMEEARKVHMIIDVTNGSGWPPGGPFLNTDDGFLSLEYAAITIDGGVKSTLVLPRVRNNTPVASRLQAVTASRILPKTSADTTSTVRLDQSSTRVLTSFVKNDTLSYTFPPGQWKVIAFWAIPSGQQTNIAATPRQGPVLNHFDSTKVRKQYDHLFGERTGLQPYFGNPMRAIFNDSYEFQANRHYSTDFIAYFKKERGYDITPFLAANMVRGYNFVNYLNPHAKPDFQFSDEDWRLRYDYDITLGGLFGEHFLKTSREWMEKRGLLHRTQAYGFNMDMIAMAGLASIPETESMLGTEANVKIMTSGALLYNKPIMTAESAVFPNQAYATTPQTLKLAVDKLFAEGVNQIIFHGVPYRYTPERLGSEGWYPFSTPLVPNINFSSNLGEGNIFWKDQKQLNEYITRVQYALRAGKPHADVLIYFPFLNVDDMPDNPEEIFTKGTLQKEPDAVHQPKERENPKTAWAKIVYPLINRLEAAGVTWSWVNDASISAAKITADGRVDIRGNEFQALILANDSLIQVGTAQKIKALADQGMKLLATGTLPNKQPSYLNWKENDKKTAAYIVAALKERNSRYTNQIAELAKWIGELQLPVKFSSLYTFTRQSQKEMSDGSRIQFIWNKSDEWQTLRLILDKRYKSSYWMNPDKGSILNNRGHIVNYRIPPYGSVILYASRKRGPVKNVLPDPQATEGPGKTVIQLYDWSLKADSVTIGQSTLFDWKNNDRLKFSSAPGVYKANFTWAETDQKKPYLLDLGKVAYTAEVRVNGKYVGKRIYQPYLFDISAVLQKGTNDIEVVVTPGQLNGFIGRAREGDRKYNQFKGKESQAMSAGLIGPVCIKTETRISH